MFQRRKERGSSAADHHTLKMFTDGMNFKNVFSKSGVYFFIQEKKVPVAKPAITKSFLSKSPFEVKSSLSSYGYTNSEFSKGSLWMVPQKSCIFLYH